MDPVHMPHHRHTVCDRVTNGLYEALQWCQNNSRTISVIAGSIIAVATFYARIIKTEQLLAAREQLLADTETMKAAQTALKAANERLLQCTRALEIANTLLRARNITTL